MAIAPTVEEFLRVRGVEYDLVCHPHTASSTQTAQASRLRGSYVAKAVVVADEQGHLVAVVPATHHLQLAWLDNLTQRRLGLVSEDDLARLFPDCELGAVPPLAVAYGVPTVVDEALFDLPEVYLEGGDHVTLVRMSGRQFRALMHAHRLAPFSLHF
jgi:Ala-tRNA(Pro) deacylase